MSALESAKRRIPKSSSYYPKTAGYLQVICRSFTIIINEPVTRRKEKLVRIPNLRQWREARALTQEEFAEKAGVSVRSVAGYEAGAGARPGTVRKLAAALEVGIDELLEVPPPRARPKGLSPSLEEIAREAGHENGWIMASEEELKNFVRGRTWEEVLGKSLRLLDDIRVERRAFMAIALRAQEDTPTSPEIREHFAGLFRRIGERHVRAHIWANEAARNYLEELDAPEQALKELGEVSPLA